MRKTSIYQLIAFSFLLLSGCQSGKQQQIDKIKTQIEEKRKEITDLEFKLKELNGQEDKIDISKFVTTIPASRQDFNMYIELPAKVYTDENIYVMAEIGGSIKALYASPGMPVKTGTPLAQIDDEIIRKNIDEVEGYYQLANDVYVRQKDLWDQKIGSEIQYLQAKNNKENLENKLATIKAQLAKTTVVSPISGVVDEVYGKYGQLTGPSTPLCRLVNLSKIYVEAEVAESYVGKFNKGDKVQVEYPSLNYAQLVPISSVTQQIDAANHTFKVRAYIPNPNGELKPNLLMTMKLIQYSSKNKVVIPTKFVQQGSTESYVMILGESDTVKRITVKTGQTYNGNTEILEGLNGNEQLIDLGYKTVVDGDKVTVKNNEL
jgi:RND family efflux transporter MFP subunit